MKPPSARLRRLLLPLKPALWLLLLPVEFLRFCVAGERVLRRPLLTP